MKRKLTGLSRGSTTASTKHLKQDPQASVLPARELGRKATTLLETLDAARLHEAALASPKTSSDGDEIIKRAELIVAEAITPFGKMHRAALKSHAFMNQLNITLGRRTVDLVVSNRFLKQGIVQRKAAEKALKKRREHYTRLLEESRQLQKQLQHQTHRILTAQEDERRKISRELHDEVAQTLLGINVRLLTLKKVATTNTGGLKREIASLQLLVEKSVQSINRFARELDIHQPA